MIYDDKIGIRITMRENFYGEKYSVHNRCTWKYGSITDCPTGNRQTRF